MMMPPDTYQASDRRPIAARRWGVMNRLAGLLVGAGVSANGISIAGMGCGLLAGVCLWRTASAAPLIGRILWLIAAGLILLRLLANLLDGMVAVASGTASPLGEIFNEGPDRVSDAAVLIGLGYAAGGIPWLGWLAAVLAAFTAYARLLGKSAGAPSDFGGPMAKQQRMFSVTIISIVCAAAPQQAMTWKLPAIVLAIICAGCVVTIWRRLARIAGNLRSKT
jgi:phosphatidylglycerophosphate synthase